MFLNFAVRARHRLLGLAEGVRPAEVLQFAVVGGLHPQGDAVGPGPAQGDQIPAVYAVRVALYGDLRVLGQIEALADQPQQLFQAAAAIKAGRTAAEIDGIHLPAAGQGRSFLHVGHQGLLVVVHALLTSRQGVKIAVVAFAAAEGDVDIEAQLFRHGAHLALLYLRVRKDYSTARRI